MRRMLLVLGTLAGTAALASCGGGGGSSGVPSGGGTPFPYATPAAGTNAVPSSFCQGSAAAALSVASNPSSLYVEITDPANGGATEVLGRTPVSCNLNAAYSSYTVSVLGAIGQNPQTTTVTTNKSNSLFFNAIADSSGSAQTASGTLTATARRPASVVRVRGALRRPVERARGSGVAPDRLAVAYRTGALQMEGRTPASIERAMGIQGRQIGVLKPGLEYRAVSVSAAQLAIVRAQLQARPDVAAVYQVHYRRLQQVTPNDTFFDPYDQWDMYHISMPSAWGLTLGSSSVPLAVIDTGYDQSNNDLSSRVTHYAVYYSGSGKMVVDPANPDDPANIEDTNGHGTNVAGIAGAVTNDSEGFAGVTWNDPLFAYKIFADTDSSGTYCVVATANASDCSALSTDEASAIFDAVQHGAKVINLSLGFLGAVDTTEENAIEYAIQNGVVVVAAAGNDSISTGIEYPGGYPGVVSVGASAISGDNCTSGNYPGCNVNSGTEILASYSDYGSSPAGPTLIAPGGNPNGSSDPDNLHWIFNLYSNGVPASTGQNCIPSNTGGVCAAFFAGTSQATPHVTGAVALMLSYAPSLTPGQVYSILSNPSDDDNLSVAGQGAGRLDVYKALQAASNGGGQVSTNAPPLTYFVAFAYTAGANNAPTILDRQYPKGVPVNADGSFRLSDIQTNVNYEVGVWYDANHDGIIDQGDWFGVAGGAGSPVSYSSTGAQAYGTITVQQVGSGFTLR